MRHKRPSSRCGFALIELLGVVAIVVVAAALCTLLLPDVRRRARLAGSLHNLRQIGASANAYAADNNNRVFAFTWAPGSHSCGGYFFPPSTNYNEAAAHQAVCIIRRLADRPDFTTVSGWAPHRQFCHLPLVDYLNEKLPSPTWVSPGDGPRLAWVRADQSSTVVAERSIAYFNLVCRPSPTGNSGIRYPYSSSYQIQTSFVSPDAQVNTPQGPVPTMAQAPGGHTQYYVGNAQTVLGNRYMHEVRFPSNKAMVYESVQEFFGRRLYFMAPEARVPVLCADGSAAVRSMTRANAGFYPNTPTSTSPTQVNYTPEASWEPPTLNGGSSELYNGGIRWTRSGLRGRDFQGPEVPWVQ